MVIFLLIVKNQFFILLLANLTVTLNPLFDHSIHSGKDLLRRCRIPGLISMTHEGCPRDW